MEDEFRQYATELWSTESAVPAVRLAEHTSIKKEQHRGCKSKSVYRCQRPFYRLPGLGPRTACNPNTFSGIVPSYSCSGSIDGASFATRNLRRGSVGLVFMIQVN